MFHRFAVVMMVFGLSALLVAQRPDAASAQTPKEKEKIAVLEKQLKLAQAELIEGQKTVVALKQQVVQLQTANNKLQADLKKTGTADDKTLRAVQATLDGYRNAGLIHVV